MKKILASVLIAVLATAFTVTAATWTNSVEAIPPTVDSSYPSYAALGSVYHMDAVVDLSTYGGSLTAADVIQCIPVRAGSVVLRASMNVVAGSYTNAGTGTNTAWTSHAITASLGDGSGAASYIGASSLATAGTTWVSTPAATAATTVTAQGGYGSNTTNIVASTVVTMTGYSVGKQYTAGDTVDITLAGAGNWANGLKGKILVRAWILDLIH